MKAASWVAAGCIDQVVEIDVAGVADDAEAAGTRAAVVAVVAVAAAAAAAVVVVHVGKVAEECADSYSF